MGMGVLVRVQMAQCQARVEQAFDLGAKLADDLLLPHLPHGQAAHEFRQRGRQAAVVVAE